MELATLPERLENWGRFWRWHIGQGETGSFEGQYRSPQPWDDPTFSVPDGIDATDAQLIEGAVAVLPIFYHILLKLWHVRQKSEAECVSVAKRSAGLERGGRVNFQADYAMGLAQLSAELGRPAVTRKERAREMVRKILGLPPLHPTIACGIRDAQSDHRLARDAAQWEGGARPADDKAA